MVASIFRVFEIEQPLIHRRYRSQSALIAVSVQKSGHRCRNICAQQGISQSPQQHMCSRQRAAALPFISLHIELVDVFEEPFPAKTKRRETQREKGDEVGMAASQFSRLLSESGYGQVSPREVEWIFHNETAKRFIAWLCSQIQPGANVLQPQEAKSYTINPVILFYSSVSDLRRAGGNLFQMRIS